MWENTVSNNAIPKKITEGLSKAISRHMKYMESVDIDEPSTNPVSD